MAVGCHDDLPECMLRGDTQEARHEEEGLLLVVASRAESEGVIPVFPPHYDTGGGPPNCLQT